MLISVLKLVRDKWLLLVAVGFAAAVLVLSIRNPYTGPDLIGDPIQSTLSMTDTITYSGRDGPVQIVFLADYEIAAAVKNRREYTSDGAAQVSPLDLVLAWGEMNKPEVDSHIRYSQYGRWYEMRFDTDSPVSRDYILEHSANVHMIPADDRIASRLDRIRVNDHVTLRGKLVKVVFKEGTWTSSLTRLDTGDGACEILYVTRVEIH